MTLTRFAIMTTLIKHLLSKTKRFAIMTCNNGITSLNCFALLIILSLTPSSLTQLPPLPAGDSSRNLNRCQRCTLLTQSFEAGLERTARGKFEGGDAHWEENKLKNYANSEIRLVEIEEHLCSEVSTGKDQCHSLAEELESQIEFWWFDVRPSSSRPLFDYLCFDVAKACCVDAHYGPKCVPCPGFPDNICGKRGYCSGNGTREDTPSSGKCRCDKGFAGQLCDKCGKRFFQKSDDDSDELICLPCDVSCDSCRSEGPKGCLVCKTGYLWDQSYGCVDIDECVQTGVDPCKSNSFCINTEGSYQCYQCDKSCDGCHGDGPDSCIKCAENYVLKNDICVDITANKREVHISLARYATYLGLCVATCIIFRNNIYVASVIGIVVAIYITLSEFTLKNDQFNPFSNVALPFLNS